MAKNKTVRVSEEELAALQAYRASQEAEAKADPAIATAAQQALADAFVNAIERTKAPEKKTVANRKKRTPWSPPDGVPDVKLKRRMFQHGIEISPEKVTVDVKELLNKVRPGSYCGGFVRVTLRKDRGLDISYPVRTASQRLKLVNQYGIRSFKELIERILDEKANPTKYRSADDADLYDFDE